VTLAECEREPLEPVTVERKFPFADPVHDKVDVPDPPVIVVGVSLQARLVEFVATARVTVPVNPFSGATVIVDVPAVPVVTETVVGLAEMVKSGVAVTW
jgi:hypothetical protein